MPEHAAVIRLGIFALVLLLMAVWQILAPRRRLTVTQLPRWASNLGLVVIDTVAVRLVVPLGAMAAALAAEQHGWGLFHALTVPPWLAVPLAIVALDLIIYLQHVLFHAVPLLWRLHLVHHADLDFDVTTGVRFHTLEILLSAGTKLAAVVLLGAPTLAVLLFEVLLNATSLFNHGNVRLAAWLDGVLRLLIVTPDMHRVHHSVHAHETNSNFGFNLPWWDYLFGTYRAQPADGHDLMAIGLEEFRDERRAERLHWMLALPFVRLRGSDRVPRPRTPAPVPGTSGTRPLLPAASRHAHED